MTTIPNYVSNAELAARLSTLVDRWATRESEMVALLTQPEGSVTLTDGVGNKHTLASYHSLLSEVERMVDDLNGVAVATANAVDMSRQYAAAANASMVSAGEDAERAEGALNGLQDTLDAAVADLQAEADAARTEAVAARDVAVSTLTVVEQNALDASESAIRAASSSVNATASQTAAKSSATTATAQAASATASAALAERWASAPVNEEVAEGLYSARHWAQYAATLGMGTLVYMGAWDATAGSLPASSRVGDFYKVHKAGVVGGITYNVGDQIIYNGTAWDLIDNTDQVLSVNGKVGAVVLAAADIGGLGALATKSKVAFGTDITGLPSAFTPASHTHTKGDVGLSNVDNTSDLSKPVSTATQAALDGKANTSHNHAISAVTGLQAALDGKLAGISPTVESGYFRVKPYSTTHAVSGGFMESYFSENSPAAGANWRLMARDGSSGLVPLNLNVTGEVTATKSLYAPAVIGDEVRGSSLVSLSGVSAAGVVSTTGVGYHLLDTEGTVRGRLQHNGTNLYVASDLGDLFLRPNGYSTAAGQLWLKAAPGSTEPGALFSSNPHVGKGNAMVSVGASGDHVGGGIANYNAVGSPPQAGLFAGNGNGNAGTLYFRPDGRTSGVGQATLTTTSMAFSTPLTAPTVQADTVQGGTVQATTEAVMPGHGGTGLRIYKGTGDNATWSHYNTLVHGWYGLAFAGYDGAPHLLMDLRSGSMYGHGNANFEAIVGNSSISCGAGVILEPNGHIWVGDANNRANRRRQPRMFVQAADPGAAATDGDLWVW